MIHGADGSTPLVVVPPTDASPEKKGEAKCPITGGAVTAENKKKTA